MSTSNQRARFRKMVELEAAKRRKSEKVDPFDVPPRTNDPITECSRRHVLNTIDPPKIDPPTKMSAVELGVRVHQLMEKLFLKHPYNDMLYGIYPRSERLHIDLPVHDEVFATTDYYPGHDTIVTMAAVQTVAKTSDGRLVTHTVPCDGHKGTRHDATKVVYVKDREAWLCEHCRWVLGIAEKPEGNGEG